MGDDFKIGMLNPADLAPMRMDGKVRELENLKAAAGKGADKASLAKQEEAAAGFESVLLQQLFKTMWSTVPKSTLFQQGNEEEYYRDMLSQALADNVSKHKSIGVKDVIIKEFQKREKS